MRRLDGLAGVVFQTAGATFVGGVAVAASIDGHLATKIFIGLFLLLVGLVVGTLGGAAALFRDEVLDRNSTARVERHAADGVRTWRGGPWAVPTVA